MNTTGFLGGLLRERTRDKLGAARRKGKWIGGIPVLGYDVDPRGGRLVVNPIEAECVREIFSIGLRVGTLAATLREVQERGFGTKVWTSRGGKQHAGHHFTQSTLRRLLGNVLYKECICHKATVYAGEQAALVEGELWEQVNRQLAIRSSNQHGRKSLRTTPGQAREDDSDQSQDRNLRRWRQSGKRRLP